MKDKLYIASISQDAPELAKEYGIGLELDHYCTALNMDASCFAETHKQVQHEIEVAGHPRLLFHAPFNELYPAAIDPAVREIAYQRYDQAYHLAKDTYQINKMIVHSGYVPLIYYKEWHHDRSLEFWESYMRDKPESFTICIENVMEDEPYMLARIAEQLDRKNIRLCLDIGHANCQSKISISEWIKVMSPYISHFHIHNNNGNQDEHGSLGEGTIHMAQTLEEIYHYCSKETTITIESLDGRSSLEWMEKEGYLKG